MASVTREEALEYHHLKGKPGKIEVIPTKPMDTQRDLSLAYTPGVAVPVLEIERDPELAYEYTSKGNLVAVVSNGTAILGLGDRGALGSAQRFLADYRSGAVALPPLTQPTREPRELPVRRAG